MRPRMRVLSLLAASTLLLALLASALPVGAAATSVCVARVHAGCPGLVCMDKNGDRVYTPAECTDKSDVPHPCDWMSDCCGGWAPSLWCPETD